MKKNYFIIGLVIALAILLAFLLWPDHQHDTHADRHADVIADHDTLKAHEANTARVNDSLTKEVARLKDENKSLITGQTATQRQLNAKSAEVKSLVEQVRSYNQDTGYFGHLLDSLQQQVEGLTFLVTQYEAYADSINNVNDSVKINYEAIIKEKDKRIAELQSTYDKLFKAYKDLFDTTASLQKDLRRQKLQKKIAALIGLGGLIKGFVK